MAVLDLYKHLATAAGAAVDENGVWEQTINGVTKKVTVANKALRMPTQEFLKNPDWTTYVAFHPLCELVTHGESEVLQRLKRLMLFRFNVVVADLLVGLVEIAADVSRHKTLSAKASKFLSLIPVADQTSVKNINKILDQIGSTPKHELVGMYLKRPGTLLGKTFNRVSVMKFPLATENDPNNRTIFDYKVRVADFEPFLNLYKYVVGIEESVEAHNCGSNDTVAPYLQSVLGSWFSFANHLNKLIALYGKHIPTLQDMVFDVSWEELTKPEYLAGVYNEIPALDGNRGVATKGSEEVAAEAANSIAKNKRGDRFANLAADNIEQISTTVAPQQQIVAPTAPAPLVPQQPQANQQQQNKGFNTITDLMRPAQPAIQQPMVQVMQNVMMPNGTVAQQPVLVPATQVQQPQQQVVYQQPQVMYQQPQQQVVYQQPVQQNAWPAFQQPVVQQPMMPQAGTRVNDVIYRQQPQAMYQQPQQQFATFAPQQQNAWPAFR